MTTTELLAHLRSLEIELWIEDDRLRFSAPKGALTPELRAELAAHKAEIMTMLRQIHVPPILPVPRAEPLPLSFAQQRLWFLHQVEPDSPAYNDFRIQRLEGPLDVAALSQSLDEVVRRHEVLRTIFTVQAEQPVQVINPAQAVALPLIDLQGLPADEREAEAMRLATLEIHHIFDLARGPLLRVLLLRLRADVHVMVLTIHHIVTDGWSFGVLFRELSALYAAFSQGLPSPLAQMPLQYGDYAVWQRGWLQDAVLESLLVYWRKHLADLPTLQLPADHPRPANPTNQGAIHEFALPAALHARLAALSQQEGATLFMTLLTAFQMLLVRYCNQTDIVVGTA
ncbi:MAG TPA: condensation domain-containing protein, partial [Herpetosiphonaceae bacterium]